ncbi:MAG TPA: V-type ATP synthase subunit D [Verrucomicrobiae bacterium]|nr:V-type ATP synthase subunit D [Verrucomicrobiae bacterium]
MPKLHIAPTKSNLLSLRRQLAFAEEGYDLLEQKRQILIYELMSRLNLAQDAESKVAEALKSAFRALSEAQLDIGTEALERALLGVRVEHELILSNQHLMGMRIPRIGFESQPFEAQFGVTGTSASTDLAMRRFVECLPLLARLAELETAVRRLARELRKTQRRCNALSKIFIPDYRETIAYIMSALEEREREAFIILKMIRDRQVRQV